MNSTVKRSILVNSSLQRIHQQAESQTISLWLDADLILCVTIVRFTRYDYVMTFLARNQKLLSMYVWLRG